MSACSLDALHVLMEEVLGDNRPPVRDGRVDEVRVHRIQAPPSDTSTKRQSLIRVEKTKKMVREARPPR